MIAPRNHINSLSWNRIVCVLDSIVYQDLICAFSRLSLHVVHEATAEEDNLASIGDTCVPVASLNAFDWAEVEILPDWPVGARCQFGNFIITLMILSTNQVAIIIYAAESWVLTRCWSPSFVINNCYLSIERLPFLHPLHICLQATSKALCKLVTRDIVRWCGFELLWFIAVVTVVRWDNLDIWLLSFCSGGAPYLT